LEKCGKNDRENWFGKIFRTLLIFQAKTYKKIQISYKISQNAKKMAKKN